MGRPTSSRLVSVVAVCERCAWSTDAKNAQGLAAQHFDKKGHRVTVTVKNEIVYGTLSGATRKGTKQGEMLL